MLEEEVAVEGGGPTFDPPVYIQRYTIVRDFLYKMPGIRKVIDYGCAEGKFLKYLKKLPFANEIAAVDVDESGLRQTTYCSRPIAWDFLFKRHEPLKIKVFKGDVAEKDSRLQGFDAVTCIELIEHLKPSSLERLPENIFGYIHPKVAIFTTPNSEFNILFPNLKGFRHWDHKFEWTRDEFLSWCTNILSEYPEYSVEIQGIGEAPPDVEHDVGCCTQMAIFQLKDVHNDNYVQDQSTDCQPYVLVDENYFPGRESSSSTVMNNDIENGSPTICDN